MAVVGGAVDMLKLCRRDPDFKNERCGAVFFLDDIFRSYITSLFSLVSYREIIRLRGSIIKESSLEPHDTNCQSLCVTQKLCLTLFKCFILGDLAVIISFCTLISKSCIPYPP